jgi:hypothetical protein
MGFTAVLRARLGCWVVGRHHQAWLPNRSRSEGLARTSASVLELARDEVIEVLEEVAC